MVEAVLLPCVHEPLGTSTLAPDLRYRPVTVISLAPALRV